MVVKCADQFAVRFHRVSCADHNFPSSSYHLKNKNKISRFIELFRQALRGEDYDYTQGSLRKAIVLLAVPMMLEMCLESVFAVVDIFFVNRLGKHAVSIVGLTEAVITIVYSAAIGMSAAATAVVARRVGEKNPEGASNAAAQTLMISGLIILVLSIVGYVYAGEILNVMGAEPAAVESGIAYTRIMLGGSAVIFFLFVLNGIFRGAGNASVAMKSLWLANACNIILCPILINGWGIIPAFGIMGAALATTVGRGIGVIYQLKCLFDHRNSILKMAKVKWVFTKDVVKSLIGISGPATFQFVVQSASWMVLAAIVARSGSDASAGYQTAIRLVMFFLLPAWGISNAAATLVGQNLGANQPERAEHSVRTIAMYNAVLMGIFMFVFLIFAKPLLSWFIPDSSSAQYDIAVEALRIVSSGYILYGVGMVLMQAFNGAGDSWTPTYISLVGFWLFQIPLALVLSFTFNLGPTGAFLAIPIAEALIAGIFWYYFRKGKWKLTKV